FPKIKRRNRHSKRMHQEAMVNFGQWRLHNCKANTLALRPADNKTDIQFIIEGLQRDAIEKGIIWINTLPEAEGLMTIDSALQHGFPTPAPFHPNVEINGQSLFEDEKLEHEWNHIMSTIKNLHHQVIFVLPDLGCPAEMPKIMMDHIDTQWIVFRELGSSINTLKELNESPATEIIYCNTTDMLPWWTSSKKSRLEKIRIRFPFQKLRRRRYRTA
ncbi:MAG: hypothetical protein AAF193_11320, partial [Bacteroidota bacterium]